jgi:hypothetical protein
MIPIQQAAAEFLDGVPRVHVASSAGLPSLEHAQVNRRRRRLGARGNGGRSSGGGSQPTVWAISIVVVADDRHRWNAASTWRSRS